MQTNANESFPFVDYLHVRARSSKREHPRRVLFSPISSRIICEQAAGREDRTGSPEDAALIREPAVAAQEADRFQPVRVKIGIVEAREVQQAAGSRQLSRRCIIGRGADAQLVKRFFQQDQPILQERLRRELDLLR